MSARRPWKFVLLAVVGIGLVVAIWLTRKSEKQEDTSQWAMPEAVTPATSGNVKDPFPKLKKVLTPEEIRNGHWGNEETPAAGAEPAPENDSK
jgi:hypothetical protein